VQAAPVIHGDKIAKAYGFNGGLVPGVTVSAYLCHPAVESWGAECLHESVGAHADGYTAGRGNGCQRFVHEKGHESVDVQVALFDAEDSRCFASIDVRAIYRLRD
jgi:hypothetical protein